MLRFFLPILTGILSLGLGHSARAEAPFRLHVSSEPTSLDPHQQKSASSSYLLQNLYRNLFQYDDAKGLVPDLGEGCRREGSRVVLCKIKKDLQWSDGSPLTSEDFVRGYQEILNPENAAPRADLLFNVKNAEAIFKSQKKMNKLGITAPDKWTLRFELSEKDPDFEYKLVGPVLAPNKNKIPPGEKAAELIVSGPYKISHWLTGQRIQLEKNTFYKLGNPQRPPVEVLFIPEDSIALQLYQKKELSFLRRLPTLYIPEFKKRADFYWIPVLRFDYVGYGPALKEHEKLREALALSLDYQELQRILSSEGTPGCPGIPKEWLNKDLCYKPDVQKAKALLAEEKTLPSLNLLYSTLGGEDYRRTTEWMQQQWMKNLGLKVTTTLRENKVYLTDLHDSPPTLFRKGVALDRPTCLAALETFSRDSSENYIQLKDPEFDKILKRLSQSTNVDDKRKRCTEGVQLLMDHHLLIPMGGIHFAILADSAFKGWTLNSMNHLDLSNLKIKN